MHVVWAPPSVVWSRRDALRDFFLDVLGDFWELIGIAHTCHLVQYILKKSRNLGAFGSRHHRVVSSKRFRAASSACCVDLACILAVLGLGSNRYNLQRPPFRACILLSARASCFKNRDPGVLCVRLARRKCILLQKQGHAAHVHLNFGTSCA